MNSGANRMRRLVGRIRETAAVENRGRVVQLIGLVIESEGPLAAIGEVCRIRSARNQETTLAEVVGFRDRHLLLMPLGELHGIHPGAEVIATGAPVQVPVGGQLKGRVVDGLGRPLDDKGPIYTASQTSLNLQPPHPLRRQRISESFETGIKSWNVS